MQSNGGFRTLEASAGDVFQNAGAPVNGVDAVQTLTSTATGGTFDLTLINPISLVSVTLLAVAFDVTAAALQALLRAAANYPAGGVLTCTGGPLNTTPIVITWTGDMSGLPVTLLVVSNTNATGGTVVPSSTTTGVSGTQRGASKGSLLTDSTNALLYQNSGTANKPTWGKVGLQT